jgi:hypothetical protein
MSKRLTTSEFAFAIAVETTQAINTAQAMIRDAEVAALAKHTAEKHTQCRQCQAALENFLMEYPDCKPEAIDEKHREVWEACPACRSEYVEVLNSEYCEHGNPAHLCTDCRDAWADANAPEAHHELDIHCYNGDDTHWQNGGA